MNPVLAVLIFVGFVVAVRLTIRFVTYIIMSGADVAGRKIRKSREERDDHLR